MILYLDTSNLVMIYLDEEGSTEVVTELQAAALVATSVVAYAEARAAFARQRRERRLTAAGLQIACEALDRDWGTMLAIAVTDSLSRRAGSLAEKHGLRGFDAIHLASYLAVLESEGAREVRFSTADRALARAARSAAGRSR